MTNKIISLILSLCMIFTMTPALAFASTDDTSRTPAVPADTGFADKAVIKDISQKISVAGVASVAQVNGTQYSSVQDAIDAAKSGNTVKLLTDANENIIIDKGITLNLNGFALYTTQAVDTIVINCTAADKTVIVKNGEVYNLTDNPGDYKSAIYCRTNAKIDSISAMVSGTGSKEYQGSALYIESGKTNFNNCEVFYDTSYSTENDFLDGVYIDADAAANFNNCSIESLGGDCVYVDGAAEFTNCYMVAEGEYCSAISLGKAANNIKINSGYYYGDSPLYSDTSKAVCKIYEGEFHSAYDDVPVISGDISGYANAFSKASVSGKNIISSPLKNWKTSDYALIYNGVAAPATIKVNLTSVNGQLAGYDDIKVTWSTVKNSKADGYLVNYKKGTGSFSNGKFYKKSGSRTVANLDDGYKYTFKVTPYVIINEDILSSGTKCYSNKYKTAYTYTLKKVVLSTFSRSNSKVKVTWKNINGETGYQVSRALKKTGTNIVATYKTTTATSKLISATKGKTYWYKVRAYKVVDGKKIYGPWLLLV